MDTPQLDDASCYQLAQMNIYISKEVYLCCICAVSVAPASKQSQGTGPQDRNKQTKNVPNKNVAMQKMVRKKI